MKGRLFVTYEMPEATSTSRNVAMLLEISKRLRSLPEAKVVGGLAGLNIVTFSNKSNAGTIFVMLKPWDDRKGKEHHVQSVIAKIRAATSDIKEARVLPISPPAIPGLGATSGFTFELQQTTSTDDIQQFEKVARDFLAKLYQRPEIGTAFTFFNARTPSYQVDVNREQAKKLGVSGIRCLQYSFNFLGSNYVNDFNLYGRNFR
jgi:HAE1 family hydrophobic/amphiphilic exporter-1